MFLDMIYDDTPIATNGGKNVAIACVAAGIIIALVVLLVFVLRYKKRNKQ